MPLPICAHRHLSLTVAGLQCRSGEAEACVSLFKNCVLLPPSSLLGLDDMSAPAVAPGAGSVYVVCVLRISATNVSISGVLRAGGRSCSAVSREAYLSGGGHLARLQPGGCTVCTNGVTTWVDCPKSRGNTTWQKCQVHCGCQISGYVLPGWTNLPGRR